MEIQEIYVKNQFSIASNFLYHTIETQFQSKFYPIIHFCSFFCFFIAPSISDSLFTHWINLSNQKNNFIDATWHELGFSKWEKALIKLNQYFSLKWDNSIRFRICNIAKTKIWISYELWNIIEKAKHVHHNSMLCFNLL